MHGFGKAVLTLTEKACDACKPTILWSTRFEALTGFGGGVQRTGGDQALFQKALSAGFAIVKN